MIADVSPGFIVPSQNQLATIIDEKYAVDRPVLTLSAFDSDLQVNWYIMKVIKTQEKMKNIVSHINYSLLITITIMDNVPASVVMW